MNAALLRPAVMAALGVLLRVHRRACLERPEPHLLAILAASGAL